MSVNKAILIGRLGQEPEIRYLASGEPVANLSVATDESFKDKSGERQKRTEWHKIVIFGKLAEIVQQYLHKGSQVYLEGRIQSRSYETRDGEKRNVTEIVANVMQMLDPRPSGESEAPRDVESDEPPF